MHKFENHWQNLLPFIRCFLWYSFWSCCHYPIVLSHVWLFCDPVDRNLPGSSVHGIFQTRILALVAISYSSKSSQPQGSILRLLFLLYWQANSLPLVPPGIKFPGIHGLSLSFLFCCINLSFFCINIMIFYYCTVWYFPGCGMTNLCSFLFFNILNI